MSLNTILDFGMNNLASFPTIKPINIAVMSMSSGFSASCKGKLKAESFIPSSSKPLNCTLTSGDVASLSINADRYTIIFPCSSLSKSSDGESSGEISNLDSASWRWSRRGDVFLSHIGGKILLSPERGTNKQNSSSEMDFVIPAKPMTFTSDISTLFQTAPSGCKFGSKGKNPWESFTSVFSP